MVAMKFSCNKKQQGFTLIEVLVASAIVIMSLGTLLQLFSSGLKQNQKVGELAHILSAQRTIIARIEHINPTQQKKGQGSAQGLNYQWRAKLTEPYVLIHEEETYFPREIALHTIDVQITKPLGGTYPFSFQRLGWRNK